MKPITDAERLFFNTVLITGESGHEVWTGTGFLYSIRIAGLDPPQRAILVTNKHVLEGASALTFRMSRTTDDNQPILGPPVSMRVTGDAVRSWVGHPDPRVDVAVLATDTIFQAMQAIGAEPYIQQFSRGDIYHPGIDLLDALVDVSFVGYPNGLFDSVNFLPVIRRGRTATPPYVDYEGEPAFLIDASVFPGSSGSPVFRLGLALAPNRDGDLVLGGEGGRLLLLGVLAAVHVAQVDGQIQGSLPASAVVTVEEPIDLGVVYRAETIEVCVDLLMQQLGLQEIK